jgi:hypothetical protein
MPSPQICWSLYQGRSRHPVVRVVPDANHAGTWRVQWPDGGLSGLANLTRAKDAAREWAEREALTDHRNLSVARRLKSLSNFSWSASPVRQNELAATRHRPGPRRISEAARLSMGAVPS